MDDRGVGIDRGPYPVASAQADVVAQADVLALVGDPDAVVVDVRSREEFTGERFWRSGGMQDGGRAGHIPGAVWLPIDIVEQSPDEIRDVSDGRRGADQHVVVYCTIRNRASQASFALKHLLGYPWVSIYYDHGRSGAPRPESVQVEA